MPIFTFGEARRAYALRDLQDWAAYWAVPFHFAPHFPMRTVTAGRVAILRPDATADIYRMAWVDGVDLNDDNALATALTAAGHDGEGLVAATQDPAVKLNCAPTPRKRSRSVPAVLHHGGERPAVLGNDRINRVLRTAIGA